MLICYDIVNLENLSLQEDEDKFTDLGTGNRIATMLYYVSTDVILGSRQQEGNILDQLQESQDICCDFLMYTLYLVDEN